MRKVDGIGWLVLALTVLGVAILGYAEYRKIDSEYDRRIRQPVNDILDTSVEAASLAAALLDRQIGQRVVNGLVSTEFFSGAQIIDERGLLIAKAERQSNHNSAKKSRFENPLPATVSRILIIPQDERGELVVSLDTQELEQEIYSEIIEHVMAVAFITLIIYVIFCFICWRPLRNDINKFLNHLKGTSSPPELSGVANYSYTFKEVSDFHEKFQLTLNALSEQVKISQSHKENHNQAVLSKEKLQSMLDQRDAELQQLQRMNMLGELTARVAHDFNNLLAIVSGNIEIMMLEIDDNRFKNEIGAIFKATQRGGDLTRQLLTFSGKAMLRDSVFEVGSAVDEIVSLFQPTLPSAIKIRFENNAPPYVIKADRALFEAALFNLLINSSEELVDKGEVVVRYETVKLPSSDNINAPTVLSSGSYAVISVMDNGTGFAEDNLNLALEPFFTTKENGNGMGLAMVYGFVRQSNGAVRIANRDGGGAIVSFYLPIEAAELCIADRSERPVLDMSYKGLKVLLVEDNAEFMKIMVQRLNAMGISSICASTGEEAIRYIDTPLSFDLLITDKLLSGKIQGEELIQRLKQQCKGVPGIVMTGMPEVSDECQTLLKPFTMDDLVASIDQVFEPSDLCHIS